MSTLHILRDWLLANDGRLPTLDDTTVHLPPHSFPRSTRTAWRHKKGDYLLLDAIVFFLLNQSLKLSEYIKQCGTAGVQGIPFGERKFLTDFLKGGNEANNPYIDTDVVQQQQAGKDSTPPSSTPSPDLTGTKRSHSMIDTPSKLSTLPSDTRPSTPGSSSLLPPSTWRLSDLVNEEVVYLNRVSCLQSSKDLSSVTAMWDSAQKKRMADVKNKKPRSSSTSSPSSSHLTPLILVPASLSSCLTMYNVKPFLEEGLLIPTAIKRQDNPTQPKPTLIRIHRPPLPGQSSTPFDVMDDVSSFRAQDWSRLVAVFVAGSAWQFEGWPAPFTSPAAIFAAVPAFYLSYGDEVMNKNVAQWKVHTLTAHRTKGYADRSLQMEFWNVVNDHLSRVGKQKHLAC